MRLCLLVLMLALSFQAKALDDDKAYTIGTLLMATDWAQTRYLSRNEVFYEKNSILGRNPHQDRVDIYFASSIIVYNYWGRQFVDTKTEKLLYHGALFLVQTYAILNNRRIGIEMRF